MVFDSISNLVEFLKGKKTYIVVGLGLVVLALKVTGVLDSTIADSILVALGMGGLATLRLGISKK